MTQALIAVLLFIPFVECGGIRFMPRPGANLDAPVSNIAVSPMMPPPPIPMPPIFQPESNEEQFKRADKDKNKKLNFDEFLQKDKFFVEMKKNEFKQFDTNNDSFITEAEHKQFFQRLEEEHKKMRYQYLSGMLKEFDSDKDKKLSPQELKRLLQERYSLKPRENFAKVFAKFDTHKNDLLDMDEFEFFERNIPFDQMDHVMMGGQGPMPMPMAMPMPMPRPMGPMMGMAPPQPLPAMKQNHD